MPLYRQDRKKVVESALGGANPTTSHRKILIEQRNLISRRKIDKGIPSYSTDHPGPKNLSQR